MSVQIKRIKGQLLDLDSKDIIVKGQVEINLIQPHYQNSLPEYEANITINDYKPEIDRKSYILRTYPKNRS